MPANTYKKWTVAKSGGIYMALISYSRFMFMARSNPYTVDIYNPFYERLWRCYGNYSDRLI